MEYRYPIQSGIPGQVPAPMPFPDNNRMQSQDDMRLHEALANGIGRYVMAHFLLGTNQMQAGLGVLMEVGRDYLILMDPCTRRNTYWDLYSLKYLTVYNNTEEELVRFCELRALSQNIPMAERLI